VAWTSGWASAERCRDERTLPFWLIKFSVSSPSLNPEMLSRNPRLEGH
jgi:hypothetical protein